MTAIRRVAIIGGNRIPFARSNTAYAQASNQEMLTATLQGLVDRFNLHGERLGDVAAGAVIKHSRDFNLVRESVLSTDAGARDAGLRPAARLRHRPRGRDRRRQQDRAGPDRVRHRRRCRHHVSDAPIGVNEKLRRILLDASAREDRRRSASPSCRGCARACCSRRRCPRNGEPRTGYSMGEHCELMAREWDISRDDQDAAGAREPPESGQGLRGRLLHRPGGAVQRASSATTTCAPTSRSRSCAR